MIKLQRRIKTKWFKMVIFYVLDVSQQGILYQIVHINKIQEKTDCNSRWTIGMRR